MTRIIGLSKYSFSPWSHSFKLFLSIPWCFCIYLFIYFYFLTQVRMYEKYCERNNWKFNPVSSTEVFLLPFLRRYILLLLTWLIELSSFLLGWKRRIQDLCDGDKRKACIQQIKIWVWCSPGSTCSSYGNTGSCAYFHCNCCHHAWGILSFAQNTQFYIGSGFWKIQ